MAKRIKKIAVGAAKHANVTWFPELSDKSNPYCFRIVLINFLGPSTKTHLYYCMKNCEQSPVKLSSSIMNIVEHYKV